MLCARTRSAFGLSPLETGITILLLTADTTYLPRKGNGRGYGLKEKLDKGKRVWDSGMFFLKVSQEKRGGPGYFQAWNI